MPPEKDVDAFNRCARHFENSVEFRMDADEEQEANGTIWNNHVQEIMARDPATREKTVTVNVMVMDASDLYRRSDETLFTFKYITQPCLASYMTIESHPLGEYGFKEFVFITLQETIWNKKPWLCFKCQSPDTRYSSLSCKILSSGGNGISMLILKLPACLKCLPEALCEKAGLETKIKAYMQTIEK